jgi:hypothetical protein
MWASFFSCVLLGFGLWVVALNWACTVASYRLQQSRMQWGACVVPVVAQVLVGTAALVSSLSASPLLPGWLFWLVAMTDVALLQILYLPVLLMRREFVRKSNFAAVKLRSTAAKTWLAKSVSSRSG